MHAFVLTTRQQMGFATLIAACALWMGVCTAAMLVNVFAVSTTDQAIARERSKSERWIADREARLNSAVAQLSDKNGSIQQLAQTVTKRHEALAMVLGNLRGAPGAANLFAQNAVTLPANASPLEQVRVVRTDQERLLAQAENFAKTRGDRLRLALRLAGLNPETYSRASGGSLGGPLIDAKDPRALAVVMDVDEDFARRISSTANEISAMKAKDEAAGKLPLAIPTSEGRRSSGFGVRFDPFNHAPAFHSGQDFAGAMRTPIYATGPGVVSFTGVRSGYGNVIEIDHGGGFKTRFAHLSAISVSAGQRVSIRQRIGAMGNTGRSTGPHLHYEVWANGRAQNPDRFLKAGQYVQ